MVVDAILRKKLKILFEAEDAENSMILRVIGWNKVSIDSELSTLSRSSYFHVIIDDEDGIQISGRLNTKNSIFKPRVEVTIGIKLEERALSQLSSYPELEMALAAAELEEESESWRGKSFRFDVVYGGKSHRIGKEIKAICAVLSGQEQLYRAVTYDRSGLPDVLGELDDQGLWVGPSALVLFQTKDGEFVLNASEEHPEQL